VEWRLFEAAVASSTARVCGQKRLGVAKDGKKVTRWWNQQMEDAVQAKKLACRALVQNRVEASLHSRYAEALNYAAQVVKKPKIRT